MKHVQVCLPLLRKAVLPASLSGAAADSRDDGDDADDGRMNKAETTTRKQRSPEDLISPQTTRRLRPVWNIRYFDRRRCRYCCVRQVPVGLRRAPSLTRPPVAARDSRTPGVAVTPRQRVACTSRATTALRYIALQTRLSARGRVSRPS